MSFIIANLAILILFFIIFSFLDSFSRDINSAVRSFDHINFKSEEIKISAISLLKYRWKLLSKKPSAEILDKLSKLSEEFLGKLKYLGNLYKNQEDKKIISEMISIINSLQEIILKSSLFYRNDVGVKMIDDLFNQFLDIFSEFQNIDYHQNQSHNLLLHSITEEIQKNMMITLIIGFFATILLGLVVPGKIALPFKKIKDAIRELQDCNFDISIYYRQNDEIGEIAREMNKMIQSFKIFEDLRTDRVAVEKRKFDVLANMMKDPVLVSNASGKLIYINNPLYSLLQIQTEDILEKDMIDTIMPHSIIESYTLAIKRRSKIENAVITIPAKREDRQNSRTEDAIFTGYANVIPIRGKDSSLDYYLMILSREVFV